MCTPLCLVVVQIERIEFLRANPMLLLRPPTELSPAADVQIERIELLRTDPLLHLRPPTESSPAADRIDCGEGGGGVGPVLWLSASDRGEDAGSGREGTGRRAGQEDAGEGLGDRGEGEGAQGHMARDRRRRRGEPGSWCEERCGLPGDARAGDVATKCSDPCCSRWSWNSAPRICISAPRICIL
jgi:hypothetical protein